jgi:hypothetical protein
METALQTIAPKKRVKKYQLPKARFNDDPYDVQMGDVIRCLSTQRRGVVKARETRNGLTGYVISLSNDRPDHFVLLADVSLVRYNLYCEIGEWRWRAGIREHITQPGGYI